MSEWERERGGVEEGFVRGRKREKKIKKNDFFVVVVAMTLCHLKFVDDDDESGFFSEGWGVEGGWGWRSLLRNFFSHKK